MIDGMLMRTDERYRLFLRWIEQKMNEKKNGV